MNPSNKLLSDLVTFKNYSQYLEHLGRRELFSEAVNRTMNMHLERFPKLSREITKAFSKVHNLAVLPSMRSLQFGGKAVEANEVRSFNCFTEDTEFVTHRGVLPFSAFKDGERVFVQSHRGWKPATVKKFGKAQIVELTLTKGNRSKTIKTTANHRWVLKTGSGWGEEILKTTEELRKGDVLARRHKMNRNPELKPCPVGIQHGIVFGDGTKETSQNKALSTACCIVLCDDSTELSRFFDDTFINGGDEKRFRCSGMPSSWKTLPALTETNKEYLFGFLAGWFASDGSIGKKGSNIGLYSANKAHLEWARSALAILDIYCDDIHVLRTHSPFDGSPKPLFGLTLNTEDVPQEFLLKTSHQKRFKRITPCKWRVKSIRHTNAEEDVWCVVEPEKECFTLACGVVTKNCSFSPLDNPRAFAEGFFVLLAGCGFGFSVQRHHVNRLPVIKQPRDESRFIVADSIEGWAEALDALMRAYFYRSVRPLFDFSLIRAKGSTIHTTGSKAPGAEPLKTSLQQVETLLKRSVGRKLKPIEAHDIMCVVSDAVLAGGIRRAAMISLFDRDDTEMLKAKAGEWWREHPHRARANNSAVLPRKQVSFEEFQSIMKACEDSHAGEPGIFWTEDESGSMGGNPCLEISLNPRQFCNLSTINLTSVTSKADFLARVHSAALIGTLQASYTNFPYLSEGWKHITEQEALIGVSMTGVADTQSLITPEWLEDGAWLVREVNEKYAKRIGINPAARTTAVKPEGTASVVCGSSSGIHARHAPFYLRRVQMSKDESLYIWLKEKVPHLIEDYRMAPNTAVIALPQKSPEGSVLRAEETALSQIARVMTFNKHWVHPGHVSGANKNNVSATISVRDNEWPEVVKQLWKDRDLYTGVSLLPLDTGTYEQAPFEELDEQRFNELSASIPQLDFSEVREETNNTSLAEALACAGGACELPYIK